MSIGDKTSTDDFPEWLTGVNPLACIFADQGASKAAQSKEDLSVVFMSQLVPFDPYGLRDQIKSLVYAAIAD